MPLHAVAKLGHAFLVSAMGATEDASVSLYAVSDHPAPAMPAGGCKRVDGAFETVEDVRRSLGPNFESLVVVISANFTDRHHVPPSFPWSIASASGAGNDCGRAAAGRYISRALVGSVDPRDYIRGSPSVSSSSP